ncbi:MAG TPA: hypothetical protein VNA25_04355 [Phycisphaerae bacterium]|nr:hypothetical protein [Phycisphaerae bacterium]
MKALVMTCCTLGLLSTVGCTSYSQRTYVATYEEVFQKVPVECQKCGMTLRKVDLDSGLIELSAYRVVDMLLTASPMIAGDDVFVKVTSLTPTTTQLWITSKTPWQIGPDLGRTERNVNELVKVLDSVWVVADKEGDSAEMPATFQEAATRGQ